MNTKKRLLWMFFALLIVAGLQAQGTPVQITGSVLFSQESLPAPGYPVWVTNAEGIEFGGATDDNGDFAIQAVPSPNTIVLTVDVLDFCTGELIVETVTLVPGAAVYAVEPFHVCQDILPPPPPEGCDAFFYAESNPANNLSFTFHDLSYSESDITSWHWDFGDGSTSEEQNPVHEYDTLGGYLVTLTITADSCASTFVMWINIGSDDCLCPDVYDPVCVAVTDDIWQDTIILTFNNSCEAECQGFSPEQFVDCANECDCPEFYDPVCVIDPNGIIRQFDNFCFALCEGYTEDQFVDCDSTGCICPTVFDPVCVQVSPTGPTLIFDNACLAECAGYTPDQFVDCGDCVCPDIYDPVCVYVSIDSIGLDSVLITFSNACEAECAGYTPDQFVDCGNDCNCFLIYDPVCVQATPAGPVLTFTNACFAECAGFTPDQFVPCDSTECICPAIYDPVCVIAADGSELHFINACYAECAGFTPDQFVDCNGNGEGCYANFFVDFPNPIALSVQFTDASYSGNGDIVSWSWTFGDGATSTEQNPAHTYAADGIYEVTLTIVTADSCTSTTTEHICIGNGGGWEGPDCQAMFYFTQDSSDLATFYFQDYSLGNPTSWLWNFGDGNTSDEQNPTHTYATAGVYIVTLTISSANCENTVYMLVVTDDNILYENTCTALYLPFIFQDSLTVFLLNLSSPDAVAFEWDYGDGSTSTEPFGFHQYAESGVYTITLTITTADGCTSSFSSTINFEDGSFRGTPQYSIVNKTSEAALIESFTASPNPASTQVTLVLELARSTGELNIEILSADGKIMTTRREGQASGKHLSTFDVADWASGLYIARIQSGNEVKTLRFVKQ